MRTIGFIGGGRITTILLEGFKKAGIHFEGVNVYDTDPKVLVQLEKNFPGINCSSSDPSLAAASELLMLALHPPVLMENLEKIRTYCSSTTCFISLAPKITIKALSSALGAYTNIARMIPNAASYCCAGHNPVSFHAGFSEVLKKDLMDLFAPLGSLPVVDEDKLEAYAMISAMGHTYFWFQFQELLTLAREFGMQEKEAEKAVKEMVNGSVEAFFSSGLNFEQVNDLIPVKPMAAAEEDIRAFYREHLTALYRKIHN